MAPMYRLFSPFHRPWPLAKGLDAPARHSYIPLIDQRLSPANYRNACRRRSTVIPDRLGPLIPVRVEKLRFLAEEMQIAMLMAQHLTEPFYARTLARHVLIRAENFIEHAR